MAYTPGPWRPIPYSSMVGAGVAAQPNKDENSIVIAMSRGADRETANANACLMAAAPELLIALEWMLADPNSSTNIRRAGAIATKARGLDVEEKS